jgi:predicted ATPase
VKTLFVTFNVRNYKSIQDSGIVSLKPLTILTGPNSSGKSNLLESFLVLPQMVRFHRDSRDLYSVLLDGEFYRYPRPPFEYITYKQDTTKLISLKVAIQPTRERRRKDLVISFEDLGIKPPRTIGYEYSYDPTSFELFQTVFLNDEKFMSIKHSLGERSSWRDVFTFPEELENQQCGEATHPLDPEGFSLERIKMSMLRDVTPALQEKYSRLQKKIEIARSIVATVEQHLKRVFLISTPRGIILPSIKAVGQVAWVGKSGENIIQILSLIFGSRRYDDKADRIVYWTERFGLGKIKAGYKGGEDLASDFYDYVLEKDFNLALASYGSRQLLAIIVQIFWSNPGDIIVIEEPEISLHPESQVLLQEMFAEAVRDGKQIIFSTHSPFLVLSIPKITKLSQLSVNDVIIYHVEKTKDGTKLKQLELDENGFIRGWIPSYLKVEDDLFREWAEKIESN